MPLRVVGGLKDRGEVTEYIVATQSEERPMTDEQRLARLARLHKVRSKYVTVPTYTHPEGKPRIYRIGWAKYLERQSAFVDGATGKIITVYHLVGSELSEANEVTCKRAGLDGVPQHIFDMVDDRIVAIEELEEYLQKEMPKVTRT